MYLILKYLQHRSLQHDAMQMHTGIYWCNCNSCWLVKAAQTRLSCSLTQNDCAIKMLCVLMYLPSHSQHYDSAIKLSMYAKAPGAQHCLILQQAIISISMPQPAPSVANACKQLCTPSTMCSVTNTTKNVTQSVHHKHMFNRMHYRQLPVAVVALPSLLVVVATA